MSRPRTHLYCTEEGCDRPHKALGLCLKHYRQMQRALAGARVRPAMSSKTLVQETRGKVVKPKARKPRKPPVEVTALYSWPDRNHTAPHGQRLVRYTCPACKRDHLAAWLPFSEHPGEKRTTCSIVGGMQGSHTEVFVLAPPADRQYLSEPTVLSP